MSIVYASMIDKDTGIDVTTGVQVKVTLDGGIQADGLGVLQHEGNGQWSYSSAIEEEGGVSLGVLFYGNNSVPQSVTDRL